MRQSRIYTSLVVVSLLAGLSFVLFIVLLFINLGSIIKQDSSVASRPIASVQSSNEVQPAAASTETPAPAAEVNRTPVVAETETQEPTPAPAPTYIYSETLAAAGISTSDFGFVTEMVLDPKGWRTSGPNLWSYALRGANEPLVWNIQRVDHYVLKTYGSWSAAHSQWLAAGDF